MVNSLMTSSTNSAVMDVTHLGTEVLHEERISHPHNPSKDCVDAT